MCEVHGCTNFVYAKNAAKRLGSFSSNGASALGFGLLSLVPHSPKQYTKRYTCLPLARPPYSFNGQITRVILPPAHDLGLLSRGFYKRSSLLTSVPSRRPCLGREVLCPASPPLLNTDPEGMRAFFLLPLCSRTRLRLLQVFGFSLGAHWLASSVHLFQGEPIQKETSPVRYVM